MNRSILLISIQENLDVLGLKSLHNQLLHNGYDSQLLFCPAMSTLPMSSKAVSSVCNLVDEISPLFIGISLMSVEFERAIHLTQVLKQHNSSIPILWGGIHPTIAPENCLDYADFVCIGEGELFILDFASALAEGESADNIGSLSFRRNGQIIRNSLYPLNRKLSSLPSCEHVEKNGYILDKDSLVRLDVQSFKKYARYLGVTYSIITSRGCPYSCTYCCNNALAQIYDSKTMRFREFSDIITELKRVVTEYPFVEYINFQDDCFLARKNADMERFCQLYQTEIARPFICRSIPTFVTESKLAIMKSAGLAWISIGLQSGSERVCRDVYKRRSTRQNFLKAARAIKQLDLAAFYDVILDNPFETDEDLMETVQTLMETPKPFYTQFFSLSLYPATELREIALSEGFLREDEYKTKDYLLYKKTPLNNLVRLAAFLPSRWTKFLAGLYKKNPDSLWRKTNTFIARLFAVTIAEPVTYFKVIWLSQGKKFTKTLRILPSYFRDGLSRFWSQFRQ